MAKEGQLVKNEAKISRPIPKIPLVSGKFYRDCPFSAGFHDRYLFVSQSTETINGRFLGFHEKGHLVL